MSVGRWEEDGGGWWGGEYRTAPHLNTLCLSANCCPEKSSRRCVGGFYGLRGGLTNSLALIPPPNLIAALWSPAARPTAAGMLWLFSFFFGTQTQFGMRQVCQVWGPTEHPTLGLQRKFWNTCSLKSGCTPRPRLLAHAGTQGGGSDDVKHYQLHVWSRTANSCTVTNIIMPQKLCSKTQS